MTQIWTSAKCEACNWFWKGCGTWSLTKAAQFQNSGCRTWIQLNSLPSSFSNRVFLSNILVVEIREAMNRCLRPEEMILNNLRLRCVYNMTMPELRRQNPRQIAVCPEWLQVWKLHVGQPRGSCSLFSSLLLLLPCIIQNGHIWYDQEWHRRGSRHLALAGGDKRRSSDAHSTPRWSAQHGDLTQRMSTTLRQSPFENWALPIATRCGEGTGKATRICCTVPAKGYRVRSLIYGRSIPSPSERSQDTKFLSGYSVPQVDTEPHLHVSSETRVAFEYEALRRFGIHGLLNTIFRGAKCIIDKSKIQIECRTRDLKTLLSRF